MPLLIALFLTLFSKSVLANVNQVNIYEENGYRYIKSNGIADHKTGSFPNSGNPNAIKAQNYIFRVTTNPNKTGRSTQNGRNNFGVALNGVPFEPGTAEYYNNDRNSGYNIEGIGPKGKTLGIDISNAHVQPTGAYHYHAIPWGLVNNLKSKNDKYVHIGFAADGFKIYSPTSKKDYFKSSYKLRAGNRKGGFNAPSGNFDGTYTQDFEYNQNYGDLDDCNGIEFVNNNGIKEYAYFLTNDFPFIPRCFKGIADASFAKKGGNRSGRNRDMNGNSRRHPHPHRRRY